MKVWFYRIFVKLISGLAWLGKADKSVSRTTASIPIKHNQLKAYIYRPEIDAPTNGYGVVLYFHGGGMVLNDIDVYDPLCRDLCRHSGQVVISVNYRRAPEHPFPAAPEDAIASYLWLVSNAASLGCDIHNITLAGDSTGANLACVTSLCARLTTPSLIRRQLLIYPVTDHYVRNSDSYAEVNPWFGLNRKTLMWFWDTYYKNSPLLKPGQVRHELSTPAAVDDLSGLPETLLITAKFDPLRDEGVEFVHQLQQAGVVVTHSMYDAKHGFVGTNGPTANHQKTMAEIGQWLSPGIVADISNASIHANPAN
ncbi:Carboxylesterase NlhH [BD1-7 clade bacterium]|uniref:Carboxylesterase NlhH n=1 Tax=BD1-7 clade bacterium TaxID=2029982 RepID=A0A5S9QZA1_9GAMM|nr:Carboxylesterase NlhH [BD1-7 clade bacterium]